MVNIIASVGRVTCISSVSSSLMTVAPQPLHYVRESTHRVLESPSHVTIDETKVAQLAVSILGKGGVQAVEKVEWDAGGWHYQSDARDSGPLTCQYVMVLDTLNFCFWPSEGLAYEHLAVGLKRALEADPTCFDADKLATLEKATLASWVEGFELPQLEERVRMLREVGRVLQARFDGLAKNIVMQSNRSVEALVSLVTSHFPCFRDEAVYKGAQVFLYKRVQILAGDIYAAYVCSNNRGGPFDFRDLPLLTTFSDYRVPQILRARGVLRYSADLAARVDAMETLPAGGEQEVEIRAATVQAVERLKEELGRIGAKNVTSLQLDWMLWQEGEQYQDKLGPHHRTLTIFY